MKSIQFKAFPSPIKLSDHQFALIPSIKPSHTANGIYTYNTTVDDWEKYIDYPPYFQSSGHTAAFDIHNNIMYVINSRGDLYECNGNSQKVQLIFEVGGFGSYPGLVLINDEFHIFGKRRHAIYHRKNKTFTEKLIPNQYKFYTKSVQYLQSKNIILIFSSINMKIYLYSLSNYQWSEKDVPLLSLSPAIATTFDERFVIMIGQTKFDYIWIYDVEKNEFLQSKIRSPSLGVESRAIVMSDDYVHTHDSLISGFVGESFDGSLPLDIIIMIQNCVGGEDLHIIERNGKHWKIDMRTVLNTSKISNF